MQFNAVWNGEQKQFQADNDKLVVDYGTYYKDQEALAHCLGKEPSG